MSMRGVWAASVTPLKVDLSIDHDRFASYVAWLFEKGCDGVAVFGSTGEANSFSVAERTEAASTLAGKGIDMSRIVVGAGACAYPDSVAISRNATDLGCAGVLVTPPFYYKGVSDNGITDFFERLFDGTGDGLRVMLYHFPRLVAIGYSESLIARLVARWPDQVVALKDSSGDLNRMKRLTDAHPSLSILTGNERLLLELAEAGGGGCLTASANLTSSLASRVWETRDPQLQADLTRHREALQLRGFVPGLKQILSEAHGDTNWLSIRPPLERLAETDAAAFAQERAPIGIAPNLR